MISVILDSIPDPPRTLQLPNLSRNVIARLTLPESTLHPEVLQQPPQTDEALLLLLVRESLSSGRMF